MRYLILLSILLLSYTASGCNGIAGTGGNGPDSTAIVTSRTEYHAQIEDGTVELQIPHTFTNRTDDTVFVVNCNNAFAIKLQKKVGNEWIDAVGLVIPDCLSPAIEIASGETYNYDLKILAGTPASDNQPKFEVDRIEGTYRIVWSDVLETYSPDQYPFGEPLPLDQRVSNEFIIR